MLASGMLALLRYGFGSLFVVGESVAAVLLRSTGADIAGTMQRLDHPLRDRRCRRRRAGCSPPPRRAGVRRPASAAALAALSAHGAWRYG